MSEPLHPAASAPLPPFVTGPGETDVLMIVMSAILLLSVAMFGVLYLRLHALPDHLAHKKVQFEIVCVLGLIAMFTHMNIFWIAGLLLALIDVPDWSTPLKRIAGSTAKMAGATAGPNDASRIQLQPSGQIARVMERTQGGGSPLKIANPQTDH